MKKVLIGGLLGGIIIFAWSMISWMVLPFHAQAMNNFKDEAAVQTTIMMNISKPGVYTIPGCAKHLTTDVKAQKELKKKSMKQMAKGPCAYVVVNPNGLGKMPVLMIRGLVLQILGLMLVIVLLNQNNIPTYFGKVLFFVVFAVAASIVGIFQSWNWWGFPVTDTLLEASDLIIGYFLAGLLIAKCPSCCQASAPGKKK